MQHIRRRNDRRSISKDFGGFDPCETWDIAFPPENAHLCCSATRTNAGTYRVSDEKVFVQIIATHEGTSKVNAEDDVVQRDVSKDVASIAQRSSLCMDAQE